MNTMPIALNHVLMMAVMALTTYLIRMMPMLLLRKPIRSVWIQSFLYYVPYAVLSAMTFPAIWQQQLPLAACLCALLCALIAAWKGCSLIQVAAAAAVSAWLCTILLP